MVACLHATKKILIIDDDPVTVRLLESRFQAQGYGVVTAFDGFTGLEKAKQEEPDLITLDIMMPELNGYSVCSVLKSNQEYSSIPIIMLTLCDSKENREFDEKVRPEAYFTKPFNMAVLLDKVEELTTKG